MSTWAFTASSTCATWASGARCPLRSPRRSTSLERRRRSTGSTSASTTTGATLRVEIYRLNVRAIGRDPKPSCFATAPNERCLAAARDPDVRFDELEPVETPVYDAGSSRRGRPRGARLIIEQVDSTTSSRPDVSAEVDEWLNLR